MCIGLLTGCLTSITCNICQKINMNAQKITRLYYGCMLFSSTVISTLMLSNWASHEMKDVLLNYWFNDFVKQPDIPKEVIGSLAVYRVMSGVCLFHLCLSIILININTRNDKRIIIHEKGMCIKLVMYCGMIVCMFILSSDIFIYLTTWPFKLGGTLFIMIQIMFLTSFIYDLYEGLLDLSEKQKQSNILTNPNTQIILADCMSLSITLCSYLFTIISSFIFIFKSFYNDETCIQWLIASIINLCMMIFVSLLSISRFVRDAPNGAGYVNSIFQSSLISAYSTYLMITAFMNHPNDHCQIFHKDNHGYITKSVSLLFTFLAIIWSTVRSGSNKFLEQKTDLLPIDNNEEDNMIQYSYSQFHLIFVFGSMYIANILTRWGDIDVSPGNGVEDFITVGISDSELSVGIKLLSSFSCYLFYMWIMLVPLLFPHRDFT